MLTSHIESESGLEYLLYHRTFLSHITIGIIHKCIDILSCERKRQMMQDNWHAGFQCRRHESTRQSNSVLNYRGLLRNVYPVQELADVLLSYSTYALDGCGWELLRTNVIRQ